MEPWKDFKTGLNLWTNSWLKPAFADLQWIHAPTYLFKPTIDVSADEAERFQENFEYHTLSAVIWLMTELLDLPGIKAQIKVAECLLGNAEEEPLVTDDIVWQPSFVVKFRDFAGDPETRLIGHVEFLAGQLGALTGQPGALTEAYELRTTAKYGSLRCVFGDLVQWMLMNNHRYSFLVSSDEIMYLRMNVKHVVEKGKFLFCEPRLHYSLPMKITDLFDAKEGTITVRLGLLYLFWLVIRDDKGCKLPEDMGKCLNYAIFTDDGKDLKIRRPRIPGLTKGKGKGKEIVKDEA